MDLFTIDDKQYPLLKEKERYILGGTLNKGDCVYIPGRYWYQTETKSETAFLMQFEYEPLSKLSEIFFEAISQKTHIRD